MHRIKNMNMEAIKLTENISMFDETLIIPECYRVFSKLRFATIFYNKREKCFGITTSGVNLHNMKDIDNYLAQINEAKNAVQKANDYLQAKNRMVRNKIN